MNIELLLGFQIIADIVLFCAIISLVVVVTRENKKRATGLDTDTLNEFRKLIEESQNASEFLLNTINEGRKSLRDLSYTLDQKEKRLNKLIDQQDMMAGAHHVESTPAIGRCDSGNTYERVITLARQGIPEKDIAESLDMPEGEISLIMGLDRKKIENA